RAGGAVAVPSGRSPTDTAAGRRNRAHARTAAPSVITAPATNTARMPTTSARIPAAAIEAIDAVWIAAFSAPPTRPRVSLVVAPCTIVIVVACTGITNAPTPNIPRSRASGPGTTESRATHAA